MNNPYINEENANEVAANDAAATQPSAVDNAINNYHLYLKILTQLAL